jgi:flagellar biosynthetic protein FliQ
MFNLFTDGGDELPRALVNESFVILSMASAPFLVSVLVVGLIVGVLQAATQVNDPAVSFLPRALTGVLVAWAFGPFAMEKMATFFASAVARMAGG